jgi:hypothetical protein
MTTVGTLLQESLFTAGVTGKGQQPDADDMVKALDQLNKLVNAWNVTREHLFVLQTMTVPSTGAQFYTIGPGGNFDTLTDQRPARIESAFIRLNLTGPPTTAVDIPLNIIYAQEDYDTIALKQLGSLSDTLYYQTTFPLGKLFFYPIPAASVYGLFITFPQRVANYTTAQYSSQITLPLEYLDALEDILALRLCKKYGFQPSQELKVQAKEAMQVLEAANFQPALMQMPETLPIPSRKSRFNIYSGN